MNNAGEWWSNLTAAGVARCQDRVDVFLEKGGGEATSQDLALAILLGDDARRSQLIDRIEQVKDERALQLIAKGLRALPDYLSSQWKRQIANVDDRLGELQRQRSGERQERLKELAKSRDLKLKPKKSQ